jgi:hypothetical protein
MKGNMKITKRQLRKIIRESLLTESLQGLRNQRGDLLNNEYEQVTTDTQYPYGRNRGDVRRTTVYKRLDGQPIPEEDTSLLQRHDDAEREAGGSMAALGGIHTTTVSDDGMSLTVKYYRHTAG